MAQPEAVSFIVAFLAGLAYFLSPCVLPLVPSYISYITGISFEELREGGSKESVRLVTIIHSLLFIAGFSLVFIILGASASFLSQFLSQYLPLVRKVGGVLIVILGFFIAGWLKIPFLMRERHWKLSHRPAGYFGSGLIGISFAAGWTACSTPILSAILIYTSTGKTIQTGIVLLTAFSLGLALPFFLSSLTINSFLTFFKRIKKYLRTIEIISGILLIIFGILVFTNYFSILSGYLVRWTDWQGF